ncbi:MAG: beta-ketoacyl-ACP synthase II [Myxococcota bacterium]
MAPPPVDRRGVVVTGMGCVTPLGDDVDSTWEAAVAGRSGVDAITRFDASDYPVRFAAECSDAFDVGDLSAKDARRLDRTVAFSLAAARQALEDAALRTTAETRGRMGVAVGSGIGGLGTLEESFRVLFASGPRRVPPFTIPMAICNMSSGYVAIRHDLRGPNLCAVAACASGTHAIGEAARVIERGDADVMVAGGSEAPITRLGVSAFHSMRALSTRNDDCRAASRPFDRDRDGFVLGEGAAVLVIEGLEHALARGARILAHVRGFAANADAAHIAQPAEDAEGAARCMRLALSDAGLAAADVDHLNPHATSTPAGDAAESRAIVSVFGRHVEKLAVSATKSTTGHLLGASGAVEALLCVRSLETGVLPPTINLEHPDPDCALDHVTKQARRQQISVAMSNSFGFGGTNACLILAAEARLSAAGAGTPGAGLANSHLRPRTSGPRGGEQ